MLVVGGTASDVTTRRVTVGLTVTLPCSAPLAADAQVNYSYIHLRPLLGSLCLSSVCLLVTWLRSRYMQKWLNRSRTQTRACMGSRNHVLDGRHLAKTIEPSSLGGNAACCCMFVVVGFPRLILYILGATTAEKLEGIIHVGSMSISSLSSSLCSRSPVIICPHRCCTHSVSVSIPPTLKSRNRPCGRRRLMNSWSPYDEVTRRKDQEKWQSQKSEGPMHLVPGSPKWRGCIPRIPLVGCAYVLHCFLRKLGHVKK